MSLTNIDPQVRGKSLQLVVAMHGWTLTSHSLGDIREAVAGTLPDADLIFPDYPAQVLSSVDPLDVAQELVDAISGAVSARELRGSPYDEVILIGHSLGALLIRKAFVFARGQTQDIPGPVNVVGEAWANRVSRIILLAGTNRGWSLRKKARKLSRLRWLSFVIAAKLWRWGRLGRLINSVREGSPFVVNLRIQWLNLLRPNAGGVPTTVQLLGKIDDIVDEYDNVDIQSGANFIYRRVPETGHRNVIEFPADPAGTRRREEFLYALTTPATKMRSDAIASRIQRDPAVQRVVFVMHGIRDYGHWTRRVAEQVELLGASYGMKVKTQTPSYGFFPMIAFLLQPERQKNVRWFMDEYTEMLAAYPNALISYVGHSNGTYLLASALQRYAACTFDRVVFAGSVVARGYPWHQMISGKRIVAIQNYVATHDWVVAIFPAVFEYLPRPDLGCAGHNGFLNSVSQTYQITYVKGAHGAAIQEQNHGALAEFSLGRTQVTPYNKANKQSALVQLASRLCWLIWIFLLAVLVAFPLYVIFHFDVSVFVRIGYAAGYLTTLYLLTRTI